MSVSAARRRDRAVGRLQTVFLFLAATLMLGWLLINLKFLFLPLLLALFGAILLSPPVERLCRLGLPRTLSLGLTLAGAAVLIWLGGRYIAASFAAFSEGFPKYEARLAFLIGQAKELTEYFPFLTPERIRRALEGLSLAGLAGDALNSFFAILGYLVMTLLFLVYFLPGYPLLPAKIRRAFPDERGRLLCRSLEAIDRQARSYILAKTVASLLTGLGVSLACLFFGADFAVTWGVFAAALNFIPTVGTILSILPPALVCFLQPELGGLSAALGLALTLALVMLLTGNILEPLLLGQSVNLSPAASLLALFVWGWLWGTAGLIVAVPAMAMVKFICDEMDSLKPVGRLLSSKF